MVWIIIGILTSYLIGSVPSAYIMGRVLKGVDIRKFGSGNVGATNALRVLGKPAGVTVLILDILKGVIAVLFLGNIVIHRAWGISDVAIRVMLGICCICGHNWTIFLKFKGGKGMATTLGVLLGLAVKVPGLKLIFVLVIITWLVVFLISRIVSLASILSAISLCFYMIVFRESRILIYTSLLLSAFVILRHKSNLNRLFQGKEPRLK